MPTEETWKDIVQTNYVNLLHLIDTQSGLEGIVKSLNFFTTLQHKTIWGRQNDTIGRNERLLNYIAKGDFNRFQTFCRVLEDSGQGSIVTNHLSEIKEHYTSSRSSDDPRCCTALRESYRDCLRQKWNVLLEKIDGKEMEIQLTSRQCLTDTQLTRLKDFPEDLDKIDYVLKMLENGPQKLFDDFCESLRSMKRHDLVEILTPSKAQLALDDIKTIFSEVELQCSAEEDRKQKVNEIESKLAYAISDGVVKGRVVIFSNQHFVKEEWNRKGTEYDEANLQDFFGNKLKFETSIHRGLTAEEMRQNLRDEARKDLQNFNVFILFILSHGKSGEIYGMDCKTVSVKDILDQLDGDNCPQLVAKPKLVFIQACRNVAKKVSVKIKVDAPVEAMNNLTLDNTDPEVKTNTEELRIDGDSSGDGNSPSGICHPKADMIVVSATIKGDSAYREKEGSFFIRFLVDVFTKKAHKEDIVSMVTEALRLLHDITHVTRNEENQCVRQLGEHQSRLLRKVYLRL